MVDDKVRLVLDRYQVPVSTRGPRRGRFGRARSARLLERTDAVQVPLRDRFAVDLSAALSLNPWRPGRSIRNARICYDAWAGGSVKHLPALLFLTGLPLAATSLTQAERDTLLAQLSKSAAAFLNSLEGVLEAQWNYQPGPGRWSIADCAEHVVTGDQMMFVFASQQLLKMTPSERRSIVPTNRCSTLR
jgi:hypothetical protein